MEKNNKIKLIAHFTSSLPKACGVATYSVAIQKSLQNISPDIKSVVYAIDDIKGGYKYGKEVKYHFWESDIDGYKNAAKLINESDVDLVDIQHEFGLYGSKVNTATLGQDDGKNFLEFIRHLKKPAVTTLHMVYKDPPVAHKKVVKEICNLSKHLVVLSQIAKKMLVEIYEIDAKTITVIPHGAPNVPKLSTGLYKEKVGYKKSDLLISSFGLIRPKKGYEYLIEAMPKVIESYPNAKLLIAGRAHPQRSPEYYEMLQNKVKELKLESNVRFINKFVDYSDLLNYLMATNIFVAPFLVMDQVSSGSLIYAMAAGRASIATPFDYAKEVLANKRGILVLPADSDALSKKIIYLLKHPKARHIIENKAYEYARKQTWPVTAEKYLDIFNKYSDGV